MQFSFIQRIMGLLLILLSLTMLFPVGISLLYDDGGLWPFVEAGAAMLAAGTLFWYPVRRVRRDMHLRDGYIIVSVFWLLMSFASAVPLFLADQPAMSYTDALFEAVSGLTTTGATVLTDLDALPHSILWYRAQLHWLGGMGIIVLAVAILPMLGIGGAQLYRAEAPGPIKDSRITPRIAQTAKALWLSYVGLTALCTLAYWFGGMTFFDAITHAFSTLATGGFSTHDASFSYFDSPLLEWIAIVFMALGGVNFALYFLAMRNMSLRTLFKDAECRTYLMILFIISIGIGFYLLMTGTYSDISTAIRTAIFQVVSIMTTTGLLTANFSSWPAFVPILLIAIMFIGGCGGSTAGGMKVIRVSLLFKQSMREFMRLIHPNAVLPIKMGGRPVDDEVVESVWGFAVIYIGLFLLMSLMAMAAGLEPLVAFSAIATTMNNVGPGLGKVSATFAGLNDFNTWLSTFSMLLGRLEVFTLLVLFTPAFWRH